MEYGIVYLLTNPVMPGLVKIGMTTQEDIDKRMKELYTTGVPIPFECQFACKVKKGDCAKIEKALHTAFAPQRINANREFFRIQVEQAKAILELFHHTDVTEVVSDEIQNDLTDDDKAASAKAQVHRPALNFYEMGLQKGDVLVWKEDPSISVSIISDRKVCYEGEEMSISALSAKLKGYKIKYIAPGPHWLYNDKLLSDIYDETYPFEDKSGINFVIQLTFSVNNSFIRRKFFGDYIPYSPKSCIFAENLRRCTYMNIRDGGISGMMPQLF